VLCPFVEFAPRGPLEQRAWNAAVAEGVWRYHHATEKRGEQHVIVRRPEGLVMAEALARCQPADADDAAVLVELLGAIETGAITGAHRGRETAEERRDEEGAGDG
jgi:hypothetical protein